MSLPNSNEYILLHVHQEKSISSHKFYASIKLHFQKGSIQYAVVAPETVSYSLMNTGEGGLWSRTQSCCPVVLLAGPGRAGRPVVAL